MAQNGTPIGEIMTIGIILILIFGVFSVFGGAFFIVDEGERAVITQAGDMITPQGEPIEPGLHFKIPFYQNAHIYETRVRAYTMTGREENNPFNAQSMSGYRINGKSQNELNMFMDMTVKFRIQKNRTPYIYQNIGQPDKLRSDILRPTIRAAIRDEMSQYSRTEIVSTKRQEFKEGAKQRMEDELGEFGIEFVALDIRNIIYPQPVEDAIEEKEATEERIAQKEKEVEVAKQEARRKIEEAKGIAQSNQIIGSSLSQGYVYWYYIKQLDSMDTVYFPIGSDNGGLPMFKDIDSSVGSQDLNYSEINASEIGELPQPDATGN